MGSDGLFTQVHLDHLYSKGVWDVADRVLPLNGDGDVGENEQVRTCDARGDEVQKLDAFANQQLVDSLIASGTVHAVASEHHHPCKRKYLFHQRSSGIFLYPRNRQQPDGGLRLMLEVNPHALLIEQAGGMVITGDGKSPLTIVPKTIDDRASLIMGSRENVEVYAGFLNG